MRLHILAGAESATRLSPSPLLSPPAVSNHRFQDAGRIRTYRGEYVSSVEEIQFLAGDWEFTFVFEAIKGE